MEASLVEAAWEDLRKTMSRKALETFPKSIEADLKVNKTYVMTQQDLCVPKEYQEMFAKVGGYTNLAQVESGHAPFLQCPDKLVAIIKSEVDR
jgi:hypothetical protein